MDSSLAFELVSLDAIGQAELVAAGEVAAGTPRSGDRATGRRPPSERRHCRPLRPGARAGGGTGYRREAAHRGGRSPCRGSAPAQRPRCLACRNARGDGFSCAAQTCGNRVGLHHRAVAVRPHRQPLVIVDRPGWTSLANVTGWAAISLPLGVTSQGLPIGVRLIPDEAVLLQLAAQLEVAAPWLHRWPSM